MNRWQPEHQQQEQCVPHIRGDKPDEFIRAISHDMRSPRMWGMSQHHQFCKTRPLHVPHVHGGLTAFKIAWKIIGDIVSP